MWASPESLVKLTAVLPPGGDHRGDLSWFSEVQEFGRNHPPGPCAPGAEVTSDASGAKVVVTTAIYADLTRAGSLEDQLVYLTVSVEAVGLKSVAREYVDEVPNDHRTVDSAVCSGGCQAADLLESTRVRSE
jgi:hypothetical protein